MPARLYRQGPCGGQVRRADHGPPITTQETALPIGGEGFFREERPSNGSLSPDTARLPLSNTFPSIDHPPVFPEWINDWIEEALKLTNNDNPRENYIPCTVILKETEEVIGSVGSTYYEDVDKVGICYFIGTPFREKGYMTEAINAYVQFFFKQYSESEIIATILDANTPSWKVAEKSGFNLIEKKMYKDIDDEKEELYRFYVIRGQEDK